MKEAILIFNINDKQYTGIFNTLVLRNYSEIIGAKTVDEAISSLLSIYDPEYDENGMVKMKDGIPVIKSVKWSGFDNIVNYVLCGIAESCRRSNIACELTFEDVFTIADDSNELAKIMQLITGHIPTKKEGDIATEGK